MDAEILRAMALKYIWWKSPDEAMQFPKRVIEQVLELGDYTDMQYLVEILGEDYLRQIIQQADPGVFSARSWTYWHYRLRLSEPGQIPDLPQRKVA